MDLTGCAVNVTFRTVWVYHTNNHRGNWTTDSLIRRLADCQLADWTSRGLWSTRGLDKSRTGELAVSQMPPKERKPSTQSRRWHPRVVQSASCPVTTIDTSLVPCSCCRPVPNESAEIAGSYSDGLIQQRTGQWIDFDHIQSIRYFKPCV